MKQPTLPGTTHHSTSNRGKDFEKELDSANDFYRLRGIVDVVKNAEKWVYCGEDEYKRKFAVAPASVARDGNNRPMKRMNSDVDYSGGNDSIAVIFDAKESAKNTISMTRLEPHQIGRLYQSSRCGTVAGFLIKFTACDRVFFAPVDFVREKEAVWLSQQGRRAAPGTASISISELETRGAEIFREKINGLWNWFEVLGRK